MTELFAAIDVRDGRCVRLMQGDFDRQTTYDVDPVDVARRFAAAGAHWIHVVDLDAARTGQPANLAVVLAIAAAVDVPVQCGGGVRSEERARLLLDGGVTRVVVGTAAVEDPDLVGRLAEGGNRVAVGLDLKGTEVVVRGWEEGSGVELATMLDRVAGAGADAVVVTPVATDGTLAGPDLATLATVLEHSDLPLVASGGVGAAVHLRELAGLEAGGRAVAGVIVGKALHDGVLTVEAAVAALAGGGPP
jgi:phosphoribosylformimino-5-aminoimidazole carboxamide ribotide isomerase